MSSRNAKSNRTIGNHPWVVSGLVLVLLSFGVMAPGVDGAFLNWDDDRFVVNNPHVNGFSKENLHYAFGGLQFESYQPLQLVSYMIDGSWWPERPVGYRLHNFVLFLLSVSLLLWLFKRLGFSPLPALFGTLFFALAPYRVESVVWIAARKDVLMLLFGLGAWHFHLTAMEVQKRGWLWQILSSVLVAAALLSKSSALTLPFLMGIVDVAFLRKSLKKSAVYLAMPSVMALLVAVILPVIWHEADLVKTDVAPGFGGRLVLIGWTLGHYFDTIIWPLRLSPLYAAPSPSVLEQGMMLGFGGLVIIAFGLFMGWKRKMAVGNAAAVMLFFLVALTPFLNLFPMYYLVADRYLLLPSIGLALAIALFCKESKPRPKKKKSKKEIPSKTKNVRRGSLAITGIVLVVFAVTTVNESLAWRNSETLWSHAVVRQPGAFYARLKLGETLRDAGKPADSAYQYRMAQRIRPLSPTALGGIFWGELLVDIGEVGGLSHQQAENLAFRFVAIANDGPKLIAMKKQLNQRGMHRAAQVIENRLKSAKKD